MQKNGSVRFRDRRTGEFVCTDYGDRVVFRNHHDRNALADKLDLIAPVLFERDPRMGFEPEGNDKQFNGNDSNLLIVFYVQIMPDDFVMQLHRF